MLRINTPLTGIYNVAASTKDINTLVTQGTFEGFNVTPTNGPNSDTNFKLLVAVGSTTIEQLWFSKSGAYTRTYTIATTTWGAWANGERAAEDALYASEAQGALADTALQEADGDARYVLPGDINHALVPGGAAGALTVSGVEAAATLLEVMHYPAAGGIADLTAEFEITAADTIDNTDGTVTTGDKLLVRWVSPKTA